MKWVLIYVLISTRGMTTHSIDDFSSKELCERAGTAIEFMLNKTAHVESVTWVCTQK